MIRALWYFIACGAAAMPLVAQHMAAQRIAERPSTRATIMSLPVAHSPKADSLAAVLSAGQGTMPDSTRVNVLIALARELWASNLEQSRARALEALALAERAHYTTGEAGALNTVGVTYYYQGWYDIALVYHQRALALRTKLGDSVGVGHSMNNIGLIYMGQNKFNESLFYLSEALAIYKRLNRAGSAAAALNNIGSIYRKMGKFDSAAAMHRSALAFVEHSGNASSIALCYFSMSGILEDTHQFEEALASADKALELYRQAFNHKGILISTLAKASTLLKMKRYTEALRHAEEARTVALQMDSRPELRDCYELLARIQEAMGAPEAALAAYKQYATLKDSLLNEESFARTAEFNAKYDAAHKEKQIALLTAEGERDAVRRNLLLALIALSVALAAFVYARYRIKRKSETELQEANARLRENNMLLAEARTRLEEKNRYIEEQNAILQQLNDEKNEFLGIVAHDLKNPISAIRGLSELVQGGFVEGKEVQIIAGQITQTSNRMLGLVKNLLNVNRLETGSLQIQPVVFDILPVVQTEVANFQEQAEAKNIKLCFSSEAGQIFVFADEQATVQILDNLISNAVKYSPLGKKVVVRVRSSIESVRVEVADEGPGLTEEDKRKMFGKFVRLSAQPTGGEHSTGLGLSIVKKMVEAMNGRVWCESEQGKGATFIVELPSGKSLMTENH